MREVLKPILTGLGLLKLIVISSFITAMMMVTVPGKVAAQNVVQSAEEQKVRQLLNSEELFKSRRPQSGLEAASQIDIEHRESFYLGYSFVRAMYLAHLSASSAEATDAAIVELVYLIDMLERRPDEAAAMQKVLQMVVRNSGTGSQRFETVQRVITLHEGVLRGEAQWFFKSGVSLSKLFIATHLNDRALINSELRNLQALTRMVPKNLPRDVMAHMHVLVQYFNRTTFSEVDRAAIIAAVDNIIVTVTA